MGVKQIWDGKDLPPVGSEVFIRLASQPEPVRCIVTGFETVWWAKKGGWVIKVNIHEKIYPEHTNQRLLEEIYPVDWDNGFDQPRCKRG